MSELASEICARVANVYFSPAPDREESVWQLAQMGVPLHPDGEGKDPISLIPKAARGDIAAHRELAEQATYAVLAKARPTATDANGNKVEWNGKAWVPVR